MEQITNLKDLLNTSETIDASALLCQMATPAEADMIRILALNDLYDGYIPLEKLKQRLRYSQPWDYYDTLFLKDLTAKKWSSAILRK